MGQARPVGGSGSGDPRVRTARITDLDALAGMWEELAKYHVEIGGPEYRLAPRWKGEWQRFTRKHIGRKDRLCLAAEIDGLAVGFLLAAILQRPKVFEHRRYGHIYDVFVEAARRNRGAGQALVGAAMDWFRARGVDRGDSRRPCTSWIGESEPSRDIRWVGGNPSPVPDEARPQADPRPSHRRLP